MTDQQGFSICFDASIPDIEQYALVGFFNGNPARQWSEMTKEVRNPIVCMFLFYNSASPQERKEKVVHTLVKYFGDKASHPIDYLEQDWCKEVLSLALKVIQRFIPSSFLSQSHGLREAILASLVQES